MAKKRPAWRSAAKQEYAKACAALQELKVQRTAAEQEVRDARRMLAQREKTLRKVNETIVECNTTLELIEWLEMKEEGTANG